jgi:hypothetical protein
MTEGSLVAMRSRFMPDAYDVDRGSVASNISGDSRPFTSRYQCDLPVLF